MSLISRNFKAIKLLRTALSTTIAPNRSIGNVNQPSDVNIFDVFTSKKFQKERAAQR